MRRLLSRDRDDAARHADLERRLVWVFGSPRTGSTWLLNLACSHPDVLGIDEPGIGLHLALFAPEVLGVDAAGFDPGQLRVNDSRAGDEDYFFAEAYADVWRRSVRAMILDRIAAQLDRHGAKPALVVIKEPNGSLAADLIMAALPQSRLLWMLRDGRDVLDSQLDAAMKGSWLGQFGGGLEATPAERRRFLEERAHVWVARTRVVRATYEAHPTALRHCIRYEEMRLDTLAALRGLYDWLGLQPPTDIEDVVARRSFESMPPEATGPGRFARAATPGLWRTNLDTDEQTLVNDVMGEMLQRVGYPPD